MECVSYTVHRSDSKGGGGIDREFIPIEESGRAQSLRGSIASVCGRISKDEEAYAVYLLGNIQHMSGHEHAAIKHLETFTTDTYARTLIAPRALYTYAAICVQYRMRDGQYDKKWNDALMQVIRQYPDSPETERAVFLLAFASEVIGDIPTAADAYRAYLKRYPNGPYRDIVQSHMNDLERKR